MSRPDSTKIDFEAYKNKPPTALQTHFANWVIEKTGYDPKTVKSKEQVFLDAIALGANLRMAHQASPENQERLAASRAETERKNAEKAAAKPAVVEDVEKPAPAKRAAKKTAAAATLVEPVVDAKPAPRRRAAKAASGAAPAPF